MAKIPLRAYNREIENQINRGQIDEAVGHCKHILRFFPKHIETYRLLGKAYLEGQHYAEASDVLQRVLSTVPDDFIAQIGMSIIREDEGNLDAAIWHMEHAFEVQPANTAVQGELRRLYGRRDGIEPPKVRLTRGALVRMYARGELYQQAIGEIRAALAEDPKRIDLEIILARMYFLSGMKVEATEICSRLITKLPFSFEANRILAEILPETARAEDAKVYQQRVDAMDPYAAYISPSAPTLADVPDNVVTLERLEWDSSDAASQKPEWARTVGIDWDEQQDALPEWMEATPEPITGEMPIVDDVVLPGLTPIKNQPVETPQEEIPAAEKAEIPEWMRAAGWDKSSGEEQPPTESAFLEEESSAPEEIASGELPDWLQGMAPQGAAEEPTPQEDQDRLNLLSSLLPGNEPSGDVVIPDAASAQASSLDAGLPDWLSAGTSQGAAQPFEASGLETPDWLASLAATSGEDQPAAAAAAGGEIPAWLQSEESNQQPAPLDEATPVAAGMADLVENEPVPEAQPTAPLFESPATEAAPESPDESFAWLEALAAKQGAAEETLLTKPEERVETPPDWLKQIEQEEVVNPEASLEPAPAQTIEASEALEEISENDVPDWLKDLQTEPEPAAAEASALADLTREYGFTAEEAETTPESAAEPTQAIGEGIESGEMPDWLKATLTESEPAAQIEPADTTTSLTAEVAEEPALPEEEAQPEVPISPVPVADATPSAEESAFAWLESLAARQGADEETLLVKPEERLDTPPDWVQQQMAGAEETTQPQAIESTPAEEEIAATAEAESDYYSGDVLPDWMKAPEDKGEPATQGQEEVPDWLKAAADELPAEQTAADDVPDWLKSLEMQTGQEPVLEPLVPETPVDAATAAVETPPPADDAFAWLEGLAAKQGAAEETLLTKPEERVEMPPEWVADQEIVAEPVAESEVAPEASIEQEPEAVAGATSTDLPDWLRDLEIEPDEAAAAIEEAFMSPEITLEGAPVDARATDEWTQELPESPVIEEQVIEEVAQEEPAEGETIEEEVLQPVAETTAEETQPVPVAPVAEPVREVSIDVQPILERARIALKRGRIQEALADYLKLIQQNQALDETVQDLKDALYQHPVDIDLWQSLGDAYAHSKHLQDALDAYTKAEELLR